MQRCSFGVKRVQTERRKGVQLYAPTPAPGTKKPEAEASGRVVIAGAVHST